MASQIVTMPTATVSSGGTVASNIWDISDAVGVSLIVNVSTAPGLAVEVAFAASSDATFQPLLVPWRSISTAVGLAAIVTSSAVMVLDGGIARQMRFTTSVASTGGITVTGVKHVRV